MRPLLALDTSTDRTSVALTLPGGPIREAPFDASTRHGRGLIPAIRDLLRAEGLTPADLSLIAVGLGPGSFTGLRIGLTAAKTFAYARQVPLVGLDSLAAIARNAPPESLKISVVADAQRGDLFVADFRREAPGGPLIPIGETIVERGEDWAARQEPATFVLGPGIDRLKIEWPSAIVRAEPEAGFPTASGLVELADLVAASGRRDDPWYLEPIYHRRSAAEEKRDAV